MPELVAYPWVLNGDFASTLSLLRDLEVRLLEANTWERDLRDPARVQELADLVAAADLQVYCVHSGLAADWSLALSDSAAREQALAWHAEVIRAAGRLGARHVVMHPGDRLEAGLPVLDQLERAAQSLSRLAPTAREAGVLLAVENLPPTHLGGSLGQMRMLFDQLDPAVFGFCCDTGHAQLAGEGPAAYVRAFPQRLIAVHWQDNHGTDDDHLFPGLGQVDWEEFFAALREADYRHPLTVEAHPPPDLPLSRLVEIARESLTDLRPPRCP